MALTKEVLVATTATEIPRTTLHPVMEIINLGPNTIWVAFGDPALCIPFKCRPILSQESWGFSLPSSTKIYAVCATLQITLAATIVTESEDGRL